jgi:hypothetical protein
MTVIHHTQKQEAKIAPAKLSPGLKFWSFFIFGLLILCFTIYVAFAVVHWRTGFGRTLSGIVPFPAATVGFQVVWYHEVVELAEVLDEFQTDDSVADSFDRALNLAVRRRLIEKLAGDLGVTVTDEEIPAPTPEVLSLMAVHGWSEADYRKYLSRPLLLAQKTEDQLQLSDEFQEIAKKKLQVVQDHLALGIAFSDIANQYSEDSSAAYGGDIGYFYRDELPAGLEGIFEAALNEPTEILEVPDGFVIAMLYDAIEIDGVRSEVGVRIIKARKATLAEVLEIFSPSQTVWYLVR